MKDRLSWLETYASFGDLLRCLRTRAMLTQKELAIAVGYSEAQISRLENGKRAPDPDVIRPLFVPALGLEDAPEAVARLLELAKQAHHPGTPAQFPVTEKLHNLPAELTSLVGREADLAEVARLLALPATRLLTLTGAGGCGKSRLALRAGRSMAGEFPHGAWWVELVTLSDPSGLPQAVVGALGLFSSANHSPVDVLTAFLRERALLLILDNCEHLVEAVARLAMDLITGCPRLKILATSREPLGAPGEILYRVPSLALPPVDSSHPAESYPSARLFLERAASIQPGFHLGEGDERALNRICHRLDGIPLAIELAAGRANVLSLSQLADRLEEGFHVLGTGGRSQIPRHATLRATVEWSYNLLPEPERVLLRRLPLFTGSWTLEQAEEICAADEAEREEVLERLARLVNKSLVMAEPPPDGDTARPVMWFRLHEMVRQYALEKLAEAGEEEALRQRFIQSFTHLAEQAESGLKSHQQLEWLASLDHSYPNLVQALTLASRYEDGLGLLRLSGALDYYWYLRDLSLDAVRWLESALAMQGTEHMGEDWLRARAKALVSIIKYRALRQPNAPELHALVDECKHIYQSLGDQNGLLSLLLQAWFVDGLTHREENVQRLRACLPELLAAGDHWTAARVFFTIGSIERTMGNITAGDQARREALVHARQAGDVSFQAGIMLWIAWAEWAPGNIRQGLEYLYEAAATAQKAGKPFNVGRALRYQAVFLYALGDYAQGDAVMERSIAILRERGAYWLMWDAEQDACLFHILAGRIAEAREAIENEHVIQFVEEHPGDYGAGMYYELLGMVLFFEGRVEQAAEALAKGMEIPDRMNEHVDAHQILRVMGQVRLAQGNLPAARELMLRSLAEIINNRTLPDFPEMLDALAQLAMAEGQPAQAARLLGASDGLLRRMEMIRYPVYQPAYECCREAALAALKGADFATAYAAGEAIATAQDPIQRVLALMEG